MFDLSAEPMAIYDVLSSDPFLAPIVAARPGLRLPGAWNGFEAAIRAVLGQQITLKSATQLCSRLVSQLGEHVAGTTGLPGLTHAFPQPERLVDSSCLDLGIPQARAAAIAGAAAAASADPMCFEPGRDLTETVARLRKLAGVGEWTAQYIAMRALGETDAFLAADVGVQRSFALQGGHVTAAELLAHAERWRPWRAYAVMHLWMA